MNTDIVYDLMGNTFSRNMIRSDVMSKSHNGHVINMVRLVKHLLQVKPSRFNMMEYVSGLDGKYLSPCDISPRELIKQMRPYKSNRKHYCNTCACALGYGPMARLIEYRHSKTKKILSNEDTWNAYSKRAFGELHNAAWYFLFDHTWETVDNTPKGAAYRLLYLLQHQFVPKPIICCSQDWCQSLHDYYDSVNVDVVIASIYTKLQVDPYIRLG